MQKRKGGCQKDRVHPFGIRPFFVFGQGSRPLDRCRNRCPRRRKRFCTGLQLKNLIERGFYVRGELEDARAIFRLDGRFQLFDIDRDLFVFLFIAH